MAQTLLRQVVRSKRLGVLLRAARERAGKSLKACAEAVGLSTRTLQAYERGEKAPSLPELVALAYTLQVPLDYFWSVSLDEPAEPAPNGHYEESLTAFHRRIAERLVTARTAKGWSLRQLAERAGIPVAHLKRYETGESPIPLPALELLMEALGLSWTDLLEEAPEPFGEWVHRQRRIRGFLQLPPELQDFVAHPTHRPYLEVAMRLSRLSVDQLRAIAEGLLEITL